MIYYLVANLDPVSYKQVEIIQRELCTKYKLFTTDEKLPKLHITVETIDEPDLELLDLSIKEIIKNFKPFETATNGVVCFEPPHKSVNLNLLQCGKLQELSHSLNLALGKKGFKVREDLTDYILHISIANAYFSQNKWSDFDYQCACDIAHNMCDNIKIKIETLELWRPTMDEGNMVVYNYNLS